MWNTDDKSILVSRTASALARQSEAAEIILASPTALEIVLEQ